MHAYEDSDQLSDLHERIDIGQHADILFGNLRVGSLSFPDLFQDCVRETKTTVKPWKFFRRVQRAFVLARYVEHTATHPGARIECGVYKGLSALLACKVLKNLDASFDGSSFYLCDSYAGLSPAKAQDQVSLTMPDGRTETIASHEPGHFAVSLEIIQGRFQAFPGIHFTKGWIPPVLHELPDTTWSFVHIDVDLYEPTKACLEYFLPRMAPGGVILNDDFASPAFPGCGKAWGEFFDAHGLPYAILDTGQAVFLKT